MTALMEVLLRPEYTELLSILTGIQRPNLSNKFQVHRPFKSKSKR